MKRGDIFIAELYPRSSSEQMGRRPVIVVSHDSLNQTPNWRSIIIVPLSTSINQAIRGDSVVAIRRGEGGLSQDSVALCHQVTTLDRGKFQQRLGTLSTEKMLAIEEGLKAAMDMF